MREKSENLRASKVYSSCYEIDINMKKATNRDGILGKLGVLVHEDSGGRRVLFEKWRAVISRLDELWVCCDRKWAASQRNLTSRLTWCRLPDILRGRTSVTDMLITSLEVPNCHEGRELC